MQSPSLAFSSTATSQLCLMQTPEYLLPLRLQYPLMQASTGANHPDVAQIYSTPSPRSHPPPSLQYPTIQSSRNTSYPPGSHQTTDNGVATPQGYLIQGSICPPTASPYHPFIQSSNSSNKPSMSYHSTTNGVPNFHQIYPQRLSSNGNVCQSIPSQKQRDFPQMSGSSYPKIDGSGRNPQPNTTYTSSDTARFSSAGQTPQYDYHYFPSVGSVSANSAGFSNITGQYLSNSVGSSTTPGRYSGSDHNLYPHYPIVEEEEVHERGNNGVNSYYEW